MFFVSWTNVFARTISWMKIHPCKTNSFHGHMYLRGQICERKFILVRWTPFHGHMYFHKTFCKQELVYVRRTYCFQEKCHDKQNIICCHRIFAFLPLLFARAFCSPCFPILFNFFASSENLFATSLYWDVTFFLFKFLLNYFLWTLVLYFFINLFVFFVLLLVCLKSSILL